MFFMDVFHGLTVSFFESGAVDYSTWCCVKLGLAYLVTLPQVESEYRWSHDQGIDKRWQLILSWTWCRATRPVALKMVMVKNAKKNWWNLKWTFGALCLSFVEHKPNIATTGDQWVLGNTNLVGYYRVNYDESNWVKLLNALGNNHVVRNIVPFKYYICVFFGFWCNHKMFISIFQKGHSDHQQSSIDRWRF